MKRDFEKWMQTLRKSIATYSYYVNFKKVFASVDSIKVELNILNTLIGSKSIEADFERIVQEYPQTLKCVPILLAVRDSSVPVIDETGSHVFDFQNPPRSVSEYSIFMKKSGLFDLLQNHLICNLTDYVTGVETGLDSNGRKNRGGHLMEDIVETYIKKSGFEKGKDYFKEVYVHEVHDKWGLDLSPMSNQGKMEKRFDFVIKTERMVYAVEANFYSGGGSKLNETARSYKTLAIEAATIPGFTFVWFTDGSGWRSARHNLEEAFDAMEHIYNINDLENGIISEVFV